MTSLEEVLEYSDTEKDIRNEVRRFVVEEIRPLEEEIDRMSSEEYKEKVAEEDGLAWEATNKMREMGYHRSLLPDELGAIEVGGLDIPPAARLGIFEEVAYGAPGLALHIGVDHWPSLYALYSGSRDLIEEFCLERSKKKDVQGVWGITEPEHGSDTAFFGSSPWRDEKIGQMDVTIEESRDSWIVNGQKSDWISAGGIATSVGLNAGLKGGKTMSEHALCIVPTDLDGVQLTTPIYTQGQRGNIQGSINFDNVEIPKEYVCVTGKEAEWAMIQTVCASSLGMTGYSLGVAQAALDEAWKYAQERTQGGKPIIEHQFVKKKLFNAWNRIQMVRAYSRELADYVWREMIGSMTMNASPRYLTGIQAYSTELAKEITSEMVQIHGGYGLTDEYRVEKLQRDARMLTVEDYTTDVLTLEGFYHLKDKYKPKYRE